VSPAKTAQPIEMPFELWTRVVPTNYVLDGVQGRGNVEGKERPVVEYSDALP